MLKGIYRVPIYYEGEGGGAGGGNPTGGAGGGVLNPPAATTPPVTPPAGVTPPGGWYEPSYAPLVQQKGWQNPNDALKGYANLETLLGEKANAIIPPKADAPQQEWDNFYTKLGKPTSADDYKFPVEGMNSDLVKEAQKLFHVAGLPPKQAEAIFKGYNEIAANSFQQQQQGFVTQSNNDVLDLQKEYGTKFDDNMELARRAYRHASEKAGLTQEHLDAIEFAVGTKTMLKMFGAFGNMFNEAGGPPNDPASQFRGTPEYAKQRVKELRADPEFRARYMHNDPTIRNAAIEEMEKLSKQAYGDAPVT